MSKYTKKKLLGIIQSLLEAVQTLKKLVTEGSDDKINVLLQNMQAAAIEAGETIEQVWREGTETVHLLEELCESIYETSLLPIGVKSSQCEVMEKKLQTIRMQIEPLPAKKTVVFLPYKASMWDSLESVWMTFREDESCEVYVIPIPYYDKNPDGSFGAMHYEGDAYPENVPVTDYRSVDLERLHPDMIFIHNPYDGTNKVTSVMPEYYAKKLRKDTEQLVYIPYFVLSEIDPENEKQLERIRHFIMLPGVMYAHKVIVQSEAMRKAYINIMVKETKESGIPASYWEDKILGTGSPKFDKLNRTNSLELSLPEDWRILIMKPDGSRKKVILYNTSVLSMTKHRQKMLAKIRSVFSVFKKNQNAITLLWRPHPLMQAALAAEAPELLTEYLQIVEEYKAQGWGIFDETSDLNRAIAVCDGYYGDGSSLVQLCQKAGVPVMIQNVEIT